MLNSLPVVAAVRQPRCIVQFSGGGLSTTTISGYEKLTVVNNSYFEADTFRVEFASSGMPAANNAAWLMQQTEVFVEIFAGFPANPAAPTTTELDSLIYGRIDEVAYDPVSTTLTVTGRDLTGAFIDAKLIDQYVNQKSYQVANALGAAHGLTVQATTTTANIGTYYEIDQVKLQANRSEWDLLCYLARQEGFVVYVSGHTLYFGPDTREQNDPYVIQWTPPTDAAGYPTANVMDLSFTRNMTVAKGISVTVRSASLTTKTPVVQSYPTATKGIAPGKSSPYGATQTYYFTLPPGHSAVQCQQYAQKMYAQIIAHAMKVNGRLPADNLLSVQTQLSVQGTGTAFDQSYFVMGVTREMEVDGGYTMRFEAQNSTPDLEAPAS